MVKDVIVIGIKLQDFLYESADIININFLNEFEIFRKNIFAYLLTVDTFLVVIFLCKYKLVLYLFEFINETF